MPPLPPRLLRHWPMIWRHKRIILYLAVKKVRRRYIGDSTTSPYKLVSPFRELIFLLMQQVKTSKILGYFLFKWNMTICRCTFQSRNRRPQGNFQQWIDVSDAMQNHAEMRIPFDVVLDSTAAAMLPCWNIANFCGNVYRNLLKLSHICEHCRCEVFLLRITWFSKAL